MAFTVINSSNGEPVANASVRYNGATYTTDDNGDVVVPMPLKTRGDVSVEAFGYMPRQKGFDYYNKRNNDTISLDIAAGKHIILRNIYYDYDKSDILPESANELDKVVAFLEANPDLTVELSSHTDSRGSDSYNLKLSEDRAQSAVKYIVSKGISASRIKGKGYGETRLLNECANGIECSEEQHRQNRRTEIYIPNFGKAKNVKQTKGKYSSGMVMTPRRRAQSRTKRRRLLRQHRQTQRLRTLAQRR
ncbi:MAG: OmpA family protein [Paludibacteraceae bacterium]|nr:OmpA family protein [Paludibacteraceae bacterium]